MMALKQYFWVIHLALITLGVYVGANLFWAVVESRMETGSRALTLSQSAAVQVQEKRPFQHYAIIQERNLFGGRGATAAPAPQATRAAPVKTPLNLKLVGTVVGASEHTYAIIEDLNAKKQDLYRKGDLIRQAKILEIARNRVLLDNAGQQEELLSFQKPDESPPAPGVAAPRAAPRQALAPPLAPPSQAPKEDQEAEADKEIQRVGETSWRVSRDELTGQFSNFNQLLTEARMTPHFTAGQADGFMITNIVKNSFLERIGLRNGDILKGINGQQLNNMDEVFRAYQQLQNEPQLRLDVDRGNQTQTFSYEIR
ncbi:MAG: PDZ domain-containing protein [Nitrospinae bacterium]|nr:PDZ domain-containing protein [Nitrospinota bacterium]